MTIAMTLLAALATGLSMMPQLAHFSAPLAAVAGALAGGAHIQRPRDRGKIAALKQTLLEKVEVEK